MEYQLDLDIVRELLARKGESYHVECILGSGTFGTVVKAFDPLSQQRVAIKFVHASKVHEYLCSEIRNHRKLRHPHVIRFKKVMEVGGHLGIVMEYAEGSDLSQVMKSNKRLSEAMARWIFQQMVLAVDYCHKKGVASRDIKCENVLLLRGQQLPLVKLSDFGYSYSTSASHFAKSIVGLTDYMAPEVIEDNVGTNCDAAKADVWSCGVVLYRMLAGRHPFTISGGARGGEKELEAVRKRVTTLDYKFPSHFSGEVCSLLKGILAYENERMSISEIMKHPWFARHFPDEADTMNECLLVEERRREGDPKPFDWQSDEMVEFEIMRASWIDKVKRQKQIVSDSFIDAIIDEDLRKYPRSKM